MRIVVYNVFLIPILMYLAQFFIIPDSYYKEIKTHAHQAIVGFRGTAFAYGHLVAPRGDTLSLSTPLRDVWAWNLTLLASQCDLAAADGLERPPLLHYDHVNETTWGDDDSCSRISEHLAHAYFLTLADYTDREHGLLKATCYDAKPATLRKRIYNRLAHQGWLEIHGARCKDRRSLAGKLDKHGHQYIPAAMSALAAHVKNARPRCRPTDWNIQFKLIFNALPFDCRRDSAGMPVRSL